jgi:hypothetical protein
MACFRQLSASAKAAFGVGLGAIAGGCNLRFVNTLRHESPTSVSKRVAKSKIQIDPDP